MRKTTLAFFLFFHPRFFPQQSFTCFPTTIVFFPGKFYGCGEAGKGLLGKKNEGLGKMKKGEWFSPFLFFPQILSFYIFSPATIFPLNGS